MTKEDEHWQDVREHAAIAALQGMLASPNMTCYQVLAKSAVMAANALVEELKKAE